MPNRVIREGLIDSEAVNALSAQAERFYVRLMLKADDFGRFTGNVLLLKAALFPLLPDVRNADISRWTAECEKAGLIRVYQVSGKDFIEVRRFNQRTRAERSKFPAPVHVEHATDDGPLPDQCPTDDGQASDRRPTPAHGDGDGDVVGDGGECSLSPVGDPPPASGCPHEEILALYHERLPANPRIAVWDARRRSHLQARWREDPKRQSVEWWDKFFRFIADECPFLTGKVNGRGDRPFRPGLEWMLKPANIVKIIEGNYCET